MSSLFVCGPPGTGKTTYLKDLTHERLDPDVDGVQIVIGSLTKTAAAEIASRLDPDDGRVITGTLHSLALRSLEVGNSRPILEVSREAQELWNQFCKEDRTIENEHWRFADWQIEMGKVKGEADYDIYEATSDLPEDFQRLMTYRARMIPEERIINERIRALIKLYYKFRLTHQVIDFTQMLEEAIAQETDPPGRPHSFFIDECQDMSKLEMTLCRMWGESCEQVVYVGDPDQNLYEWRGSDARMFLEAAEEHNLITLKQSYRVPELPFHCAREMIRRVEDRIDVEYLPTEVEGFVEQSNTSFVDKDFCRPCVERIFEKHPTGTIMFLATCKYMLEPLCGVLKSLGVPFHNPYKLSMKLWNPLAGATEVKKGRRPALRRLIDFLRGQEDRWTYRQFDSFASLLMASAWLKRGALKAINARSSECPEDPISREDIDAWVENKEVLFRLMDGDLAMFDALLKKDKRTGVMELGIALCRKHDGDYRILFRQPRVIVGTIHSVKGGECDVVCIAPDISYAAWEQFQDYPDPVFRQFYVGMTRCRGGLYMMRSASTYQVEWKEDYQWSETSDEQDAPVV